MPRPKPKPPEPIQSDPITREEFEDVVKEVLFAPLPEEQHSENREPTMEKLNQKFRLERR